MTIIRDDKDHAMCTVCGMLIRRDAEGKFLHHLRPVANTEPGAVELRAFFGRGRCHGEIATFSKMRKERISKRWAKAHLGCKREGEFLAAYRPKIGKELKEGE